MEGRRAVHELLAAGRRRTHEVWIAEGLEPSAVLDRIEHWARRRRTPVRVVARRRLEHAARTEAPQGVLARAEALAEHDLDEVCESPAGGRAPFLLVLDGVTDPHNFGALLRTAECAGVTAVVVPRHRAAHVTPAAVKVAAGAVEYLDMVVVPGVPNALRRMTSLGVTCVGLDASAHDSLFDLGLDVLGPLALVLGAEGRGLGNLTRRRCTALVTIPRHGAIDSLNVAAAGAVACFEVARRRSDAGSSATGG